MRTRSKQKGPTDAKKMRVLVAYEQGEDSRVVAKHNGVAMTTVRRVINKGHNCTYTLTAMKHFIANDFPGTDLSLQTISQPTPGRNAVHHQSCAYRASDMQQRSQQAKAKGVLDTLFQHQQCGDYIVYYDETNFNIYCHRTLRRVKKGQRATFVFPPSKGPNL
ncbi:hypothetical protein AaE_012970 [Aphanomyces astaci]|uniref:Tc1-like transposase DDE domain-containing protein n=1 Tax=Aphanomyces astaci TaxID=112090 RepID=A0A6A4ZES6_APHAT|nr:hypothetical protein AaE_012970 [Aphanomyces astaci]